MKKLFILPLLAVVMVMASCSNDDNENTPPLGDTSYTGVLTVDDFEKSTVIDIVADDETSTLTVVINDAQFAPNMPVTIDITIKNIPYTVYGENKINFEATNIDPYMNTEQSPSSNYKFATIQGLIDDDGSLTLYAKMADELAPYVAGKVFNFHGNRAAN